jgi:hypothetical protein
MAQAEAMTRNRSWLVIALMMVSVALVWSEYEYSNDSYHIESYYGPMCIPSGIYTTCNDVVQSRVVRDFDSTSGIYRGTDTPARFACVAISGAVFWGRRRWSKRLARSIVASGAIFVVWQSYGAILRSGVVAFLAGLVVIWLSQRNIEDGPVTSSARLSPKLSNPLS